MKGKKRRTITKVLTELISIVSRAKNFIDLEYNKGTFINDTNIIDSYKKSDENIDDFFKDTFGDKMIPLLDNQKMIDTLYERNKIKIPPFNDGDSDKGFMDTLIWICFLEYCKINTYDRYVFITNDEDFNNHTSTLEEEFNTLITNGNIEIKKFNSGFEVLQYFGKIAKTNEVKTNYSNSIKDSKQVVSSEVSKELISEVQEVVDNFITSEPDWNGYKSYNFRFESLGFNGTKIVPFCLSKIRRFSLLQFKEVEKCITKEVCKHLSIVEDIFIRLKRKYPILEKIQVEAKLNLKMNLMGTLYKRAIGYEYTDELQHIENGGEGKAPKKRIVKTKKYIPADKYCAVYLLTKHFGR